MPRRKLLPCPMCGGNARIMEMKNGEFYPRCWGKNGFCLLSRYPEEGRDGFTFRSDAMSAWNRRAT